MRAPDILSPATLERTRIAVQWLVEGAPRSHTIGGVVRRLATPITFTPFASARACSARCVFCSEALSVEGTNVRAANLRPGDDYLDLLSAALRELRGLAIGASISGLEATDDPAWLHGVLDRLTAHEADGGVFEERVLYSNGAGLAGADGPSLLAHLRDFALTRIELSRHHPDEAVNDRIMRFRPGVLVRRGDRFSAAVARALDVVPVRLVCLVQQGGVATLDDIERYVAWARQLGVRDVVFREASRLPSEYRRGPTLRAIESTRVDAARLAEEAVARGRFVPERATVGYYYANVRFLASDVAVTMEASDYGTMRERHASDVVHKLVFHANGNLSGGWDPEHDVLLRTAR